MRGLRCEESDKVTGKRAFHEGAKVIYWLVEDIAVAEEDVAAARAKAVAPRSAATKREEG